MHIPSFSERISRVKSKSDLKKELEQASHLVTLAKTRMQSSMPLELRKIPSMAKTLNSRGYRYYRQAQEVERQIKSQYYKILSSLK